MSLRSSHKRTRIAATVLAAAAVAFSLSACSLIDTIFPAQAQRDDDTQQVEEAGEADAFSLIVGDCFNDEQTADSEEISSVPAVPCTEEHDNEIYYAFDLTDASYPGEDAIFTEADAGCEGEFPNFVGLAYADSTLYYGYLYPSEGSWKESDREIVCYLYTDAPSTGSFKGAAI